jgi:hypothetical protein
MSRAEKDRKQRSSEYLAVEKDRSREASAREPTDDARQMQEQAHEETETKLTIKVKQNLINFSALCCTTLAVNTHPVRPIFALSIQTQDNGHATFTRRKGTKQSCFEMFTMKMSSFCTHD